MSFSIINSSSETARILIIAANNDISSSYGKGADLGPAAIRDALDTQIEFREPRTGINARDKLNIGWLDLGDLNGMYTPADLDLAVTAVAGACDTALTRKQLPFVIGGDHSNAIGALLSIANHYDPSTVTILHIDAHHDLRRDDGDCGKIDGRMPYGRFAHCCAMRPAADVGFRIVQLGIRSYSTEEYEYAKSNSRISVFYWGGLADFRPPTVATIMKLISTPYLYITIDVDGFDPSVMPATGTPVSGGLGWWYGLDVLQAACSLKRTKVIGADICEVAPISGQRLTELNAAQMAYNLLTWAWVR